jgi:glycosyltransferase involved in cell wall biosynthesis
MADNIAQTDLATVVITTRNRKDELRVAVRSALAQIPAVEVLVIDDGSTDGTADMLRAEFPSVNFQRREESKGLVVRRNEAARIASGQIILSIDDDAEFSDASIVATIVREFENSAIAAIAIPFINVNMDSRIRQQAPSTSEIWITNEYIGTAHAVRRDVFLEIGGYWDTLVHQGEEGDLCIRLLDRAKLVRLGSSAPIHHYESAQRSRERMSVFGQRNLILFAWRNVPMPEFTLHVVMTILKGLVWGIRRGELWFRCKGTWAGLAMLFKLKGRSPVSRKTYWLYRKLKKNGPLDINAVLATARCGLETRR